MNRRRHNHHIHITVTFVVTVMLSLGLGTANGARGRMQVAYPAEPQGDTTRYGVKKTAPVTQSDLKKKMADLRDPDNGKTEAELDERKGNYVL